MDVLRVMYFAVVRGNIEGVKKMFAGHRGEIDVNAPMFRDTEWFNQLDLGLNLLGLAQKYNHVDIAELLISQYGATIPDAQNQELLGVNEGLA